LAQAVQGTAMMMRLTSILFILALGGGCGLPAQEAGSVTGKGDVATAETVGRAMSIARETAAYLPQIVTTGCGVRATYIQMELALEGFVAASIAVDVCAGPKLRMPDGERHWEDHVAPILLGATPEDSVILDPVFDAPAGMTRQQWLEAMGAEPSQLNIQLSPNNALPGAVEGCGQLRVAEPAQLAALSAWTYDDFLSLTYRVSHEMYWANGEHPESPARLAERFALLKQRSCRLLDRLEQAGLLEGLPARDDPAYVPCDQWMRWEP
jgi:hypothetical protein